jgi:hypothetical protein
MLEITMKTSMLLGLVLALAACDPGTTTTSEDREQREETVGTEVARDYNNAMDKARNVETLNFENKDRMDAALEEAEGEPQKKP